jgi:drug/metabolite transporter (DMT)-like permease
LHRLSPFVSLYQKFPKCLYLKEKINRTQFLGILSATLGVVLISL